MKLALARIQASKTWRDEARPALELPGGMLSQLARRVGQLYDKRATFNSEQPIPVRADDTKLVAVAVDGRESIVLRVKLRSTGAVGLVLRGSSGSHWHTLKQLALGKLNARDCRIIRDDDRGKWYALIAYDAPKTEAANLDKKRALVVHRGIRNALTMMATTGAYGTESGAKLFAQLRGLEARIGDAKRISPAMLGDGAKGHGKARRYEHYERLSGVRDNVTKTWCQQMAAAVVARAVREGCGVVVIEDYGGLDSADKVMRRALLRFPIGKLKEAIKNAVSMVSGMELVEAPAEYVSSTCPACDNQDFRQHNTRTGTFHCRVCEFERPADFVAALNMLRRSGVDTTTWDERMEKVRKLADAITKTTEGKENDDVRSDSAKGDDPTTKPRPSRRKAAGFSARSGARPRAGRA
jgi:hypothetical protein